MSDPDQRTWLLSSLAGSDDEEDNQHIEATRIKAWKHPGSPLDEVRRRTNSHCWERIDDQA